MLQKTESLDARSPLWRIVEHPLGRIILPALFVALGIMAAQFVIGLFSSSASTPLASILSILIALLAIHASYRFYVHWLEKRQVVELSAQGAGPELAAGLLAGLGLVTAVIGILWAVGVYSVAGMNPWLVLLPAAAANIPSGFAQEILFRGILFRIVDEYLGTWIALALSALLFGWIHLVSANASLWGALAIMVEAGLLLGAAYLLTRRLWLAIGIHIGWDFALDGVFGVGASAISGESIMGLLRARLSGPAWVTGGHLGIEGSLLSVVVVLIIAILMLRQAHRKGRFVSPIKERN